MTAAALLLAPIAAADAAMGAIACADGESCVIVTVEGSAPTTEVAVPYADVAAGDVNALYGFRAQAGGSTTSDQLTGLSMRSLVQSTAGVPAGSVTFVEISARSGTIMTITGDDLADPSSAGYPFPDGTVPVVYLAGSNALGYITPIRADDQPNDHDATAPGGALSVTIHTTGRILHPAIAVDDDTVDTASPVAFTASLPTDPGTAVDYSWEFGDGASAAGAASESHAYAAAGTYQATVTARGADGSLGIAKSALVTVGAPAPATNETGAGTGTVVATPAPTTGPNPAAGTATATTPTPTPTPTKKRPHPTKSSSPTTATPRPTSPPTVAPTTAPTDAPPAPAPTGTAVSGTLITGSGTTPSEDPTSTPQAARASRAGAGASLGWGSAAVAGTVVLLGVGVIIETGLAGAVLNRVKRRIR